MSLGTTIPELNVTGRTHGRLEATPRSA